MARSVLLAAILLAPAVLAQSAGNYTVTWFAIAGGGGTSAGTQYSVSGTIGQADAGGPMSGGNYSLSGGFWSLIAAVQTLNAPTLYISQAGNTVTVYWQSVTGWSLEQSGSLVAPVSWSASSGVTSANGTNYLTISSSVGSLFFRLEQQ